MRIKRALWRLVVILVAVWLGLCVLAALFYPRLLYHPDRNLGDATPVQVGAAGYEEEWLTANDGVRLNAWFVHGAPDKKQAKTLLVFHGNAGNLSTAAPRLALYSRRGFDSYMIDYHGFGKSGGEVGEENLYRGAEAAWRQLTAERGIPAEDIVIVGYSLGGAVASWLAACRPEAAGLVLESTFTCLSDIGADFFPYLPCRLLVGNALDTRSHLAAIRMPLLVVHGRGDTLVAYRHGEELYREYAGPKEFLTIADDHNLGFLLSDEIYGDGIERFASSLGQ